MRQSTDITRTEKRHLAVASATLGPWRTAAVVGALGGGLSLALHTLGGDFGFGMLAGSLSLGLMLFFSVGGAGAVLGGRHGVRTDQRVRRWAGRHPWRVAAVPAGLLAVTDLIVRQVLTSESLPGSVWDGLWRGAVVLGAVGLIGALARPKGERAV